MPAKLPIRDLTLLRAITRRFALTPRAAAKLAARTLCGGAAHPRADSRQVDQITRKVDADSAAALSVALDKRFFDPNAHAKWEASPPTIGLDARQVVQSEPAC